MKNFYFITVLTQPILLCVVRSIISLISIRDILFILHYHFIKLNLLQDDLSAYQEFLRKLIFNTLNKNQQNGFKTSKRFYCDRKAICGGTAIHCPKTTLFLEFVISSKFQANPTDDSLALYFICNPFGKCNEHK